MKRHYRKSAARDKQKPSERRSSSSESGREIQLPLDREELLGLMQDSLQALAVEFGLMVASAILEDEVTRLCGKRYQRQPDRSHTRYGYQRGVVMLAGQKLPIERPRVRGAVGGGEVPLETYAQLQSPDAMPGDKKRLHHLPNATRLLGVGSPAKAPILEKDRAALDHRPRPCIGSYTFLSKAISS